MPAEPPVSNVYVSGGCNRTPHCLAWLAADGADDDADADSRLGDFLYGSCNSVVVVDISQPTTPMRAVATLVGHTDRVNCVRWLDRRHFVSASTDATVVVWRDFRPWRVLRGHEQSVTAVTGVKLASSFLLASASADSSVRIWRVGADDDDEGKKTCLQVVKLKASGFVMDLKLCLIGDNQTPVLFTAQDDSKIHILVPGERDDADADMSFDDVHTLSGHEDWIQTLDATPDPLTQDLLLASGGQDSLIRIWRVSARTPDQANRARKPVRLLGDEEPIRVKEETFGVAGCEFYAVSLETVLAGHDDKVFGVRWATKKSSKEPLSLLSCSMDKTMILWTAGQPVRQQEPQPEAGGEDEGEDQTWREAARVGDVGGNTLGFLGCQAALEKGLFVSYSFNGAFHLWRQEDSVWRPEVPVGGHFGPVQDLAWDREGRYLLSLSSDQTTRVHAPWRLGQKTAASTSEVLWREIARPQVHGYDLTALTPLPKNKFASGAEEKIVRVFEATKMFRQNYSSITGDSSLAEISDDNAEAQGASLPSLGLSNKAVFESQLPSNPKAKADQPEMERHVKDQYPDFYFTPEVHDSPPPEESLVQNTLWPELQKLYGHGFEIFCLASNRDGTLVASACRASKAEYAQVLLWSTSNWSIAQRLPGHALTVTQMEFSPCQNYLLTVSRDRTWCLYRRRRSQQDDDDDGGGTFEKVAGTDKKTSVHARLIWSCCWAHDSTFFATASRDKKVAVWGGAGPTGAFGPAGGPPLVLADAATSVAFAPCPTQHGSYLVAVGTEKGTVCLYEWKRAGEWRLLQMLNEEEAHHKMVKRLQFNPDWQRHGLLLASCGGDHAVKLFRCAWEIRDGKIVL